MSTDRDVDGELVDVLERIATGLDRVVAGLGAAAGLITVNIIVLLVHAI